MKLPIGVGGLPKGTTYVKAVTRRKKDDSIAACVTEGQKVYHKRFGKGIVASVDGYSAKVRFDKENELHSFDIPNDFLNGTLK